MPASTDSQGGEEWTLTQKCVAREGRGRGQVAGLGLGPRRPHCTGPERDRLPEATGATRFTQWGFGETQAFFGMVLWSESTLNGGSIVHQV